MLGETDISLHAMNRVFSAFPSLGVGGCRAKGRECNGDTEGKEMFLLLLKKKKKKRRIKHHITFMQNPNHPNKYACDQYLWDLALVLALLRCSYGTLDKSLSQ